MKRLFVLVMVFLCLAISVTAEGGVNIEVIRVDGVSVVLLTPESTMLRARSVAENVAEDKAEDVAEDDIKSMILPEFLTLIEESAFEGIAAGNVEVTENVVAIEARAFADCKNLRGIYIPATVLQIDDHAFDGCENVTVVGEKGTEAERITTLYGFTFISDVEQLNEDTVLELPPVMR